MDANAVQEQFLRITKSHSIITGLWPYQTGVAKYFTRFAIIITGLSSVFPQVTHIILFFSVDTIVLQCPFLVVGMGIVIKEITYMVHQDKLKSLFDDVFKDWAESRSEKEYDILRSYYKKAGMFTNVYSANALICILLYIQVPITPLLLDLIIPLNESREIMYMWPVYYSSEQDKYAALIIADMIAVVSLVYLVYVTCDTTYVFLLQHACALLDISGEKNVRRYRFRCAVPKIVTRDDGNETANAVYQKICYSIREHQHAISFVGNIQVVHEVYLLIATGLTMICFSVTLLKVTTMEYGIDFLKLCSFLVMQITHLLVITFPGQMVINRNDEVYQATYESFWYNASNKGQALYILPLRKGLVLAIYTAGNLVTMNFQTLLAVVKTAVSYCMVLRSV